LNPSFDQALYPKTCSPFPLFSGLEARSLCTNNSLDEHHQFIILWTLYIGKQGGHTPKGEVEKKYFVCYPTFWKKETSCKEIRVKGKQLKSKTGGFL
jgi:hypothetical protein